jgi:hypothetical protein
MRVLWSAVLAATTWGCGTQCASDDYRCILDNLSINISGKDFQLTTVNLKTPALPSSAPSSGFVIRITPLSAPNYGDPIAMIQAGRGNQPSDGADPNAPAPSIVNTLPPITFSESVTEQHFNLEYDDPYGMQPSFCLGICDRGAGWCLRNNRCTFVLRDNRTHVTVPVIIRMNAGWHTDVSPTPITPTDVEPTPIGPTPFPVPFNPLQPPPIAGVPAAPALNLPPPPHVGSPGPDPNGGPGAFSQCINAPIACACPPQTCTIQACASTDGSGCTGGYKSSSGGWFPCSSCNSCTGAAMAALSACCPKQPPCM